MARQITIFQVTAEEDRVELDRCFPSRKIAEAYVRELQEQNLTPSEVRSNKVELNAAGICLALRYIPYR
ncbi:hypothetical protein DFP90_11747 [Aestuariispira insulae]|uniref:Uncharacterized protein n=1 Tax=Aestuariispira insulae TaxID=1461337 RepID=A0A3D9H3Q4_9PROT|nr:hypothetical protein DFP90_11747 [Aestuariispira insulae]